MTRPRQSRFPRPRLGLIPVLILTAGGLSTMARTQSGQAQAQAPAPAPARPQAPAPQAPGGFGGRAMTNENTDFAPKTPYKPRTPAEEAASFMLPTGYRLELVAAEPEVDNPVAIEFDGNGRMYVAEMVSYMMDAEASREHDPISRISRWESTKGDGHFDKRTVFVDKIVAPRMILPLEDGVILTSETDSDDLVKYTDTNGDGVADKREVVFTGIGQSGDANIEHQKAGLMWGMDNWIYTTYNPFRIRWTPNGFLREATGPNGGQWGLGMDDDGKPWFVDAGGERGPMNFQFPIHYGAFTPCPAVGGRITGVRAGGPPPPPNNPACPPDMENGFEKGFAVVWPSPGIADMQGGIPRVRMPAANLNHFTAATGPAIFRGTGLPEDLRGDLLFTEPVGRLIRRARIENVEGLTQLSNVYDHAEFITAGDQLFRPVNISNAPDGTLYIADMYHGIIQERQWSGPGTYLRAKIEQYQLDKVTGHGRIWRLRYDGRPAVEATETNPGQPALEAVTPNFAPPRMYGQTPAQLVDHFKNPNGWWRDMAQRLLVLKQDTSVVPALQQVVRSSDNLVARFHALWTLEGLGALDAGLVRQALKDPEPRMRIQAARASETLYKAGDKSLADDYRTLARDKDPNVAIQGMLSLSLFKVADAPQVIEAVKASNQARGVQLVAERLLAPPAAPNFGGRRGSSLTPEQEQLVKNGSDVFGAVCFSCHGADGLGQPMAGAAPGITMAPPIAGSPRVQGHRDYVIKVLLNGLTGPVDGKTYHEVMVPMGNTDEWVAGVASYIRMAFGNSAGVVSPADVARVKAANAGRKDLWTVEELEATLPRELDSQGWVMSASHGGDSASRAATLRGWSSGEPQTAGMWFQIELPQAVSVSEIQFDSANAPGAGRGGRATPPAATAPARGAAGAAPAQQPAAAAGRGRGGFGGPAVVAYPRGYSVTTSMDGKSWSKPIASGKGEGSRTTIAFAPVEAKFVRITQTATGDDMPNWSITNLRLFEAPSGRPTQ